MSRLSPCSSVVLAATVILASAACSSRSTPAADSGVRQDGGHDAGKDAGTDSGLAADSGRPDAGSPLDAGQDAGPADAGSDSGSAADSGNPTKDAGNPTPDAGVTRDWPAHASARVMLSGHSLTDNPIADFVELLAMQHTRSYGWEQQIEIGSPLRWRTRGEDSSSSGWSGYALGKNRDGRGKNILDELAEPTEIGASERYDTLVVTERHDILAAIRGEDTVPYLRHFHDRLREQKSDARTLFYQSWPDIDGDPQTWIDYQAKELVAWECAASKVNLSLERDGAPAAVSVIPVAVALAELLERMLASGGSDLSALFTDDVHPTRLGSFLAAAATYSAVFGTSPVGAPVPENIDPAAGRLALEVAWEVVSDYNRKGATDPSRRSMEDCRTLLTSFCPEYLAIRGLSADCSVWQGPGSPMSWPDTSFPLPAP
jgi:hypothetical protein